MRGREDGSEYVIAGSDDDGKEGGEVGGTGVRRIRDRDDERQGVRTRGKEGGREAGRENRKLREKMVGR